MRFFLSILLVFFFQSWTKAENVNDFEIEGMSVGDSLLKFLSANEIKKIQKDYHYATKDFYQIGIYENLDVYELVSIDLKQGDNSYIIQNISGVMEFKEKNNQSKKDCENSMKNISSSILENFNLIHSEDEGKLSWDKSGKSNFKRHNFGFPNEKYHQISVICQYWDISTPFSYVLKTTISSNEFLDYLLNKAYK